MHYCSLKATSEERKLAEYGAEIVAENLGIDELPRIYLVDAIVSQIDGGHIAGVARGSREIRLRVGREPRSMFKTLCHEMRHCWQATKPGFRSMSDEFHETDAEVYGRWWEFQMPHRARTCADILAWLKKLDDATWKEALDHARRYLARQKAMASSKLIPYPPLPWVRSAKNMYNYYSRCGEIELRNKARQKMKELSRT